MERFVFDTKKEQWLWQRVDDRGVAVARCRGYFDFYLDCLKDAKKHGMKTEPFFRSADGKITPLKQGDRIVPGPGE